MGPVGGAVDLPFAGNAPPGNRGVPPVFRGLPPGYGKLPVQPEMPCGKGDLPSPRQFRFPGPDPELRKRQLAAGEIVTGHLRGKREPDRLAGSLAPNRPFQPRRVPQGENPVEPIPAPGKNDLRVPRAGGTPGEAPFLPGRRSESHPAQGEFPLHAPGDKIAGAASLENTPPHPSLQGIHPDFPFFDGRLKLRLRRRTPPEPAVAQQEFPRAAGIFQRPFQGGGKIHVPFFREPPDPGRARRARRDPAGKVDLPGQFDVSGTPLRLHETRHPQCGGRTRRAEPSDADRPFMVKQVRLQRPEGPAPGPRLRENHFSGGLLRLQGDPGPQELDLPEAQLGDLRLPPLHRSERPDADGSAKEKNFRHRPLSLPGAEPVEQGAVRLFELKGEIPDADAGDRRLPGEQAAGRKRNFGAPGP